MLDLRSDEWAGLTVPSGDARRVPSLLAALQKDRSTKSFDEFWNELTGEGDLAIHDAFFAAIPHATAALRLLDGTTLEEAVAQIGWGMALAGDRCIPFRFMDDYCAARRGLAEIAGELSQKGVSVSNRAFIIAAIDAGLGRFSEALSIIDDI